jgi:hypothetical protein
LSRELTLALQGTLQYYLFAGAQSLSRGVGANVKVLRMTPEDFEGLTAIDLSQTALQVSYDLTAMRRQVFDQVERLLALEAMPLASRESADRLIEGFRLWLGAQRAVQQLPAESAKVMVARLLAPVQRVRASMEITAGNAGVLGGLRQRLLATLTYSPEVPFSMGSQHADASGVDYEAALVRVLTDFVQAPLVTEPGSLGLIGLEEALVAAESLATFVETEAGADALQELRTLYQDGLRSGLALTVPEREALRSILKKLGAKKVSEN